MVESSLGLEFQDWELRTLLINLKDNVDMVFTYSHLKSVWMITWEVPLGQWCKRFPTLRMLPVDAFKFFKVQSIQLNLEDGLTVLNLECTAVYLLNTLGHIVEQNPLEWCSLTLDSLSKTSSLIIGLKLKARRLTKQEGYLILLSMECAWTKPTLFYAC